MKFTFQKIGIWSIRLAGIYLFDWWALLYLSFAAGVGVFPLGFRDCVKAIILGALGSIGLFLSTIKCHGRPKHIIGGLLIVLGCIYYIYFSMGKILLIFAFGVIAHILAMIIFINLNIKGWVK